MTDFINAFDNAIYTKLTGYGPLTALLDNGTASVYHWMAPQEADPPFVVYNMQASTPLKTLPTIAVENTLYQVKAVTLGPSALMAGSIAKQIDAALNGAAVSITGFTLLLSRREAGVDYPEIAPGGQRYHHRGAIYRIQAQPT